MPFKYVCTNCVKLMVAEDDWAGTRRACPHCGQEVLFRRDHRIQHFGQEVKPVSLVRSDPEGEPIQCAPKLHAPLAVAAKRPVPHASLCPRCHHPLAEQAVVCMSCGFDRRSGTCISTEIEVSSPTEARFPERADSASADSPGFPGLALAPGAGQKTTDADGDPVKEFRGLGGSVIVLGLLSLLFLGGAKHDMVPVALLVIGACVVFGSWQMARPSVPVGLIAGLSLVLLGGVDLVLAQKSGGLGFIAPLIDFGFAVKVFLGCAKYARS
jgi:DNA-directed RNA polymerase subunit RPC12/RpoP